VAPRNLARVVFWMSGALLAFCAMAVSVRGLAATLSVMEIFALRAGIGLIVMSAIAAARPELRPPLLSRQWPLLVFRNTVHLGSSYLWGMSLLLLPLATAFALEFTTPAWTMLLAAATLGERLTASRIGAVVLGLLGVLIILRPGLATFQPAALLILSAAIGFAISLTTTKKLTMTDSTFTIIFWMNLIQLPLALAVSDLLFVAKLTAEQIPAAIAMGITGLVSHSCLANAFRAGDASVVVPLDFLRIPLIAVIGWWLYNERLDIFVFIGAGVIVTGILWNLGSETRRTRSS
jgi:drug/metabolite transporter (DMT)-like permease